MNAIIRNASILAVAAFAGTAFAGEATYELPQAAVSSVSRAEVHAQVLQARAAGTLIATEADRQATPVFVAGKSRADVQAEARAAAASGELQSLNGEPYGFDAPVAKSRLIVAPVVTAALR